MCIKINPLLFAPRLAAQAVAFCWHLLSGFYNPSQGLYQHPCHLTVIHSLTLSHWPRQRSQQMDFPLCEFHLTVSSPVTSPTAKNTWILKCFWQRCRWVSMKCFWKATSKRMDWIHHVERREGAQHYGKY